MESPPSTKQEDEDYVFRGLHHEDFEPIDEAVVNQTTQKIYKHKHLNFIVMCPVGEKQLELRIKQVNDNSFLQQFYDQHRKKFFYLGGDRIIYAK